jgi:hypothetical protein
MEVSDDVFFLPQYGNYDKKELRNQYSKPDSPKIGFNVRAD